MSVLLWMLLSWAIIVTVVVTPYDRGVIQRLKKRLERTELKLEMERSINQPPRQTVRTFWEQFVCGCGHHYAFHERTSGSAGECEHALDEKLIEGKTFELSRERPCRCQGYVGPLPPPDSQLEYPIALQVDGRDALGYR